MYVMDISHYSKMKENSSIESLRNFRVIKHAQAIVKKIQNHIKNTDSIASPALALKSLPPRSIALADATQRPSWII